MINVGALACPFGRARPDHKKRKLKGKRKNDMS